MIFSNFYIFRHQTHNRKIFVNDNKSGKVLQIKSRLIGIKKADTKIGGDYNMSKKKKQNEKDTIHGGDVYSIRQNAHYGPGGKAEPD